MPKTRHLQSSFLESSSKIPKITKETDDEMKDLVVRISSYSVVFLVDEIIRKDYKINTLASVLIHLVFLINSAILIKNVASFIFGAMFPDDDEKAFWGKPWGFGPTFEYIFSLLIVMMVFFYFELPFTIKLSLLFFGWVIVFLLHATVHPQK